MKCYGSLSKNIISSESPQWRWIKKLGESSRLINWRWKKKAGKKKQPCMHQIRHAKFDSRIASGSPPRIKRTNEYTSPFVKGVCEYNDDAHVYRVTRAPFCIRRKVSTFRLYRTARGYIHEFTVSHSSSINIYTTARAYEMANVFRASKGQRSGGINKGESSRVPPWNIYGAKRFFIFIRQILLYEAHDDESFVALATKYEPRG